MPLSRIRPLDLKLAFADRSYGLGETIHATVELTPRSDVEIREARVDLVCEEQYLESYTVQVPSGQPSDAGSPFNIGGTYVPPRIPKQVTKDVRQTYVHSSVVFWPIQPFLRVPPSRTKPGWTSKPSRRPTPA